MSQSQLTTGEPFREHGDERAAVTDEDNIGSVLEALEDPACRTILAATSDSALTVTEITNRFEIPRSTTYRKVEALADAGLLEENLRLRPSGNNASTYACSVEDVTLSIDDETGIELSVTRAEAETAFPSADRQC